MNKKTKPQKSAEEQAIGRQQDKSPENAKTTGAAKMGEAKPQGNPKPVTSGSAKPEASPTVDLPSRDVLDRVVVHWEQNPGKCRGAREYLEGRSLWQPDTLRALHIGYSSGQLTQILPSTGPLRRQLTEMGILNDRGNEFLYKRIVVPLFDDAGMLVNAYGRSIDKASQTPHLYLPGRRRGLFNAAGLAGAHEVFLTESPLDALSFIVLGFVNTTSSYGTNGFTADHLAAFQRAQVRRVYCAYDSDPAGDTAADQLAHDLALHGIEVFRLRLPVKDPNDFLKAGGTKESLLALIDEARPIVAPRPTPPTLPTTPAQLTPPGPERSFPFVVGDRTYHVFVMARPDPLALRVKIKMVHGEKTFLSTLNLYSDQARSSAVNRIVQLFGSTVRREYLEKDLLLLIDELEARAAANPTVPAQPQMPADEHDEASTFLRFSNLIQRILDDLTGMGVAAENDNKLLVFLVAISRLLDKPLSLSIISRSGAGKSHMLGLVMQLMPPEHVCWFTRVSPLALFYDEPDRYKHKILYIEEAIGAKDAALPVRCMQSEGRLSNLVTRTDPRTGELKTQETVIEGPLTYLTSSVEPLDHETATRSFEITIDESPEQTARIVATVRNDHTIEGMRKRLSIQAIIRRNRNAQRLLERVLVVNPYAKQLKFPSDTVRLRREAGKYFSLIDAIALLHQYQRTKKTMEYEGQTYTAIEVVPSDIAIANRLMVNCLTRALTDLPALAQKLLIQIKEYVTAQAQERGCDVPMIQFNRREIREDLNWEDHSLRPHLEELVKLEYVELVAGGTVGKRFVYTLSPNHRLIVQADLSIDEKILALGLTPVGELTEPPESERL